MHDVTNWLVLLAILALDWSLGPSKEEDIT